MPLAYAIPYVALGHDTRTRFISDELGVSEYFVPHDTPPADLLTELTERYERLMSERDSVQERLARGFRAMQARDQENYRLMGNVLSARGYEVNSVGA